jgi:hypothetical protein
MVLYAPCVEAQELSITIANDRVTMVAREAPLQHVLSELARIGGVTVSGADKIAASPVTLELNAVDGRVAFDILLRNAAGYILTAREAAHGALGIDRVLILPENTGSGRLAQSGFPSPSDPEAAFQNSVGVQTDSALAIAVEAPPPTLPVDVYSPQPAPQSGTPLVSRPPSPSGPTFPVPIGFSGRPGDSVQPPSYPPGIQPAKQPTVLLGPK